MRFIAKNDAFSVFTKDCKDRRALFCFTGHIERKMVERMYWNQSNGKTKENKTKTQRGRLISGEIR